MSKGSSSRPFAVSNQEYSNRWDAIFGKDNEKKNDTQTMGIVESDLTCDNRSSDNSEGKVESTQDA
jgi:hypothetical protein